MLGKCFKIVEPGRFDLYIENIEMGANDTIVKIEYGAICKADMRYYLGHRSLKILGLKYPMSLIHEAVGTVIQDRSGYWKAGDRVILVPNLVLRRSEKYRHLYEDSRLGDNYSPEAIFASSNRDGFSKEYVVHDAEHLVRIDPQVDFRTSVLTELISVAVAAYRRLHLDGDEKIAVWGDGTLGYIFANVFYFLRKSHSVLVVGKHKGKLSEFPEYLGQQICNELDEKQIEFSVAYECVGGQSAEKAINDILKRILPGGKVVLAGVSEQAISVDTRTILEKGLSLYGTTRSSVGDFKKAAELLEDGCFAEKMKKLLVREYEINKIADLYNVFEFERGNSNFGKSVLKFNL